jgi:hypothetical protein
LFFSIFVSVTFSFLFRLRTSQRISNGGCVGPFVFDEKQTLIEKLFQKIVLVAEPSSDNRIHGVRDLERPGPDFQMKDSFQIGFNLSTFGSGLVPDRLSILEEVCQVFGSSGQTALYYILLAWRFRSLLQDVNGD